MKPYPILFAVLTLIFSGATPLAAQGVPEIPGHAAAARDGGGTFSPGSLAQLRNVAEHHGVRDVNIVLDVEWTPEGYLDEEALRDQRHRVTQAQDEVISRLPAGLIDQVYRTPYTPTMIVPLREEALVAVTSSPRVTRLEVVKHARPALSTMISSSRSQAIDVHTRGLTGAGRTVAVIDTGVTAEHSALSGKIVSEACFSGGAGGGSTCPGGVSESLAAGSGVDVGGHGTLMAGVIAASGSLTGMAPDAKIIAINVMSGNSVFAFSDVKKALDRVYDLRSSFSISAVNLSLETEDTIVPINCDTAHAGMTASMANLRSVGILPVVASGNEGDKGGISFPACISHAISVGAVANGSDSIPSFSNSWHHLDLLAAAHGAISTTMSGGTDSTGGTSAAAASVSGAIAALRSGWSGTFGDLVASLKSAGVPLTDTNSVTKPRIRVDLALPPRNLAAQSLHCYGMTDVSWEAVPNAGSYVLEGRSLQWGGSWYLLYSGTSTSPMVNIWENSEFRVKVCTSGQCSNPNQSGAFAYYYSTCM